MKTRNLLVAAVVLGAAWSGAATADSVAGQDAKPRTYWWWFGDTVTTNGITHDLEAMKRMGLGGATICANHWFGLKPGPVTCLSDAWYDRVVWAGKEADRLGLELGFHNCPGWCNTGGAWVRPQYAQRHLDWTETRIAGGRRISCAIPRPPAPFGVYREVAVLAVPDREEVEAFDGSGDCVFAAPRRVAGVRLTVGRPAGPIYFIPWRHPDYRVLVSEDGVSFREHHRELSTYGGDAVQYLTFPAVRAKAVRIRTGSGGRPSFAKRIEVFATPFVPDGQRKTYDCWRGLRSMREARIVPRTAASCPDADALAPDEIVDLTDRMDADGRLVWDAPAGRWLVLRFGSTVMDYAVNHISSPASEGLECDKLSEEGVEEGVRGPVSRIPELARRHGIRSFRTVFKDSCEAPPPNWTDRMPEEFRALRGYDLRRYLPVMTGRVVGSASASERFLWDFRRTVGDLMSRCYGRHFAELVRSRGLAFEAQWYDWPYNQLELPGSADIPMGEFWIHTGVGANDTTDLAGMLGDLYGRRIVSCEAFTDACGKVMTDGNEDIADLRRHGDRAFARGITRFMIHAYTHQPYDDPAQRTNYWHFGIRIDRHHPKFESFKPWIAYLTRTQGMLQKGRGVADAVRLVREETTLDHADWTAHDPSGYRSDAIERNLFLSSLSFSRGCLRLPSGMEYRVLELVDSRRHTPEVLRKVRALAEAGAEVLLGERPVGSPSLVDYPACDAEVEALAKALWDACPEKGSAKVGKGRVWRGVKLADVYAAIGLGPDFAATENGRPADPEEVVYTHRVDGATDIYFIANVTEKPKRLNVMFRNGETREVALDGSSSTFVEFGR